MACPALHSRSRQPLDFVERSLDVLRFRQEPEGTSPDGLLERLALCPVLLSSLPHVSRARENAAGVVSRNSPMPLRPLDPCLQGRHNPGFLLVKLCFCLLKPLLKVHLLYLSCRISQMSFQPSGILPTRLDCLGVLGL